MIGFTTSRPLVLLAAVAIAACAALAADVTTDLEVVATMSFIDTMLGDLMVQFRIGCQ